jgi:hypothetical protein
VGGKQGQSLMGLQPEVSLVQDVGDALRDGKAGEN